MAIDVPVSSDVMTPTLAPFEMHCSACARCFCGSLSAFVTDALTPAALRALVNAGLSNCSQRTEDLVSGSRTQTSTAAADLLLLAEAAPTVMLTASTPTSSAM